VTAVAEYLLGVHAHVAGNGGNEAHELFVARQAHADVPRLQIAGGLEGPLQERLAVVEAEHAVVVLHVVVVQQLVNVLHLVCGTTMSYCASYIYIYNAPYTATHLFVVVNVAVEPLECCGQVERRLTHILDGILVFIDGTSFFFSLDVLRCTCSEYNSTRF
jgi:hypothetical protein